MTNGLEDPSDKKEFTIPSLCLNTIQFLVTNKDCNSNLNTEHLTLLLEKIQAAMNNANQKIKQAISDAQENKSQASTSDVIDIAAKNVWLPSLHIVLHIRSLGLCDVSPIFNDYKNQKHLMHQKFMTEYKNFEKSQQ